MSYLRIQVLGPIRAWDVSDNGLWQPLPLSEDGWAVCGLLVALIFDKYDENVRDDDRVLSLAKKLWDPAEVEKAPTKFKARFRTTWKRARAALKQHQDVLPKGTTNRLVDRDESVGPRRVFIDWDDVTRLQGEGKHKKALSLIEGYPLPTLPGASGELGALLEDVRAEVNETIAASLEALKLSAPETPSWTQLEDFAQFRPAEWMPHTAPSPLQKEVKRPARAADGSIVRAPTEFGEYQHDQLFIPCHEGKERLGRERDEAAHEGQPLWWHSPLWLGQYVALWRRTLDTPCDQIAFTYIDDVYDAARFGLKEAVNKPKDKATLIEASKQLGDNDRQITCGTTNWGVAHIYAKDHAEELLSHPSNPSVFGVKERPVYPGILGVHTLVQTADGYLLLALRSVDVDFHELTWSASFEESVSVGAREFTGPLTGDSTLFDPIRGGLFEEWGIEEDALRDTGFLAIGREWVREAHTSGALLNLNPTILTACRLHISLDDVWKHLDEVAMIRDRDEHGAWAGCRFTDREAILEFVSAAKGRTNNTNVLQSLCTELEGRMELLFYPHSDEKIHDRGLMPTSPARLVLGSAWLTYMENIDNT